MFSHGNAIGWLAPTLPTLQSADSPLTTGPITLEEASWIGSIICVGGVTGSLTFGLLVNRIGCKLSLYLLAVPHVVSTVPANNKTMYDKFSEQSSLPSESYNSVEIIFIFLVLLVSANIWHDSTPSIYCTNTLRDNRRSCLRSDSNLCRRYS